MNEVLSRISELCNHHHHQPFRSINSLHSGHEMDSTIMAPQTTTILEQCRVAPPSPTGDCGLSLHLNFLDMPWLPFHLLPRLLFYDFPLCSSAYFLDTLLPLFKQSLSLTLQHFLPLAGHLVLHSQDNILPEIRYAPGDSVSLTFAESTSDFDYFTGDHPRIADEFYPLAPPLLQVRNSTEPGLMIPLIALQVTLFPNKGICIGILNHHVAGDASTIIGFMRAWASVHRLGGGDARTVLEGINLLPCLDRSVIKYPSDLDTFYWNIMKNVEISKFEPLSSIPATKIRAKFVINQDQIKMLKNLVLDRRPTAAHVSSFTVTCAYVWTCLVKSSAAAAAVSGDETEEEQEEHYFITAVDCRARLDPPVPATYFGNCLAPCVVRSTRNELLGHEGFLTAAESIGEAIRAMVQSDKGILADAETWLSKIGPSMGKPSVGVTGSPKFNVYDTDFGWGEPKTFENLSIDIDGSMSLSGSRGLEGGLEVGLSLPKNQMDSFATLFADGLKLKL